MLTLVLVGGLLLSTAAAAPNLCAGSCDDSQTGASSNGQTSLHSSSSYSQNKRVPWADSQILSEAEFNEEMQRMKQLIDNLKGRYALNSSSLVDGDFIRKLTDELERVVEQLKSVRAHVSEGSSQLREIRRVSEDFFLWYIQMASEVAILVQEPGSRANGSSSHNQSSEQHQRKLKMFQEQIVEFYREFNETNTSEQYRQQMRSKSERILEKLAGLEREAGQEEPQRTRVLFLTLLFNSVLDELLGHEHVAKRSATQHYEEEQRLREPLRLLEARQQGQRREQDRLE